LQILLVSGNFSLRHIELAQRSHVLLPMPSPTNSIDVVDVPVPVVVFAVVGNLLLIDPHPSRENAGIDAHVPDAGYYQCELVRIRERACASSPTDVFFVLLS